ncbi:hypothetical protein [Advenella mimigardefordensis]|uniref:hypothetical protein n=1 Tax=Advenella mimigardefordensis TaxID=302406 RepID=UPI00046CDDFF|nr:hypothetical protein [Advenella mimigardefordensis]
MNRAKEFFKTVLLFTFVGCWIGGVLFFFQFYILSVFERAINKDLCFEIVFLPFQGAIGIFFVPPAFFTGCIAALLPKKNRVVSVVLTAIVGTISSYEHAIWMSSIGNQEFALVSALLGLAASVACSLYTFRKKE